MEERGASPGTAGDAGRSGEPLMNFVLDASVTLAWAFEDEGGDYPKLALEALGRGEAVTPSLWPLEVANGLVAAERRRRISAADASRFAALLLALPIVVEPVDRRRVFDATRPLARATGLSVYDAHYLELAVRLGVPLATLDQGLRAAAEVEGVGIFRG
jgi:predicted nucleic acid-binding protein